MSYLALSSKDHMKSHVSHRYMWADKVGAYLDRDSVQEPH